MKWQDPPNEPEKKPAYGAKYATEAAELREHPGKWGLIRNYPLRQQGTARTTAAGIRTGRFTSFRPAGHFEASTSIEEEKDDVGRKKGGERVVNVYARYVGEEREFAEAEKPELAALKLLSVTDLRQAAQALHIPGYARMRKAELIRELANRTDDGG